MKHILYLFFTFCWFSMPVCGQDIAFSDTLHAHRPDWQEQLLQLVDIEELGEGAYGELLDEMSELVVWSDTAVAASPWRRLRQHLVISGNRCLSARAGFQHQSSDRQQAGQAYLGDPWRQSIRYRLQVGKQWQAGLTLEKDPGEAWRSSLQPYDSWHAFVRLRGTSLTPHLRIADAVLGHYRLRMGCGLLVHQGFSLGKQFLAQQLLQRTNSITPHSSLTESGYMQGAAIDLRLGPHLTLLPYFSARQIDGTLSPQHILTALQTDGYHRTPSEMGHRHAAWQIVSGARMGWRGEWFDVGVHGTFTQLQFDYQRQPLYYNANYFRGHQLAQFALDYTARAWGGLFRGEWAIDDDGALACINTLQYPIGQYWHATLLHRYYDRAYRQLHASAISEGSGMQGEQGVLLSLEGPLSRHLQLQAMMDWFRFTQPQYGIRHAESQGGEGTLRLLYSSTTHHRHPVTASLGYRFKLKGDYIRHTADAVVHLSPLRTVTCRTQLRARIYSKENQDPTYGYAFSQSLAWQCAPSARCQFTLEGQACYFNTDDYDSRVYMSERAVLYGFGLPMLYGQGLRYSITGTAALASRVHIDLKWALTNYANRSTISSGLQQIQGNTQHDLWLQLRLHI